jgi:hypothetical protein
MKIYVRDTWTHAGAPIYKGFAAAWHEVGYEVCGYDKIEEINDSGDYEIMCNDYLLAHFAEMPRAISQARKVYLYVQPTNFPMPWGAHPNFISLIKGKPLIEQLNNMKSVVLWNWGDMTPQLQQQQFPEWKKINQIVLAFDSISYTPTLDPAYEYDVCFVGGWADNGFNEKKQIMMEHFNELMKTGLKCGVFINKGLTHEQENLVLYNSKVALNIHDSYQRILGNDSNERTFKSLGLTGALVCDNIRQISDMFPDLPLYNSPGEMVEQIHSYLENEKLLKETKDHYRQLIADNHTYVHRVEQLKEL